MNIIVDLDTPISDGTEVVFRSPVDCSQVTGLKVYYQENGVTESKEFAFADAHGNNVGDIDHLFAENVVVKVILDLSTNMAFVQNADTNAYLEGRFAELEAKTCNNVGYGVPTDTTEGKIGTFYYDIRDDELYVCHDKGAFNEPLWQHITGSAVLYTKQTLSPENKAQVRENIGVPSKEEIVQSVLNALPIYGGETEEVVANE